MAWVIILAAGLFETGFAVALKMSHGLTRIWPTAVFAACALASFALLTIALRSCAALSTPGRMGSAR